MMKLISIGYDAVKTYGDTNVAALGIDWSIPYILTYNSGRIFEIEEKNNEIYNQYFKGKNWNDFYKDQLVFDKNTLHLCIY